jgi:alpha-tubulin suppressor-like RCC1 family protein
LKNVLFSVIAFTILDFIHITPKLYGQTDNQLSNIKLVAAGGNHSLALADDGSIWAWGDNSIGEFGKKGYSSLYSATKIHQIEGVISIAAGYAHSLLLKNDGTVWGCGFNKYGQVGIGSGEKIIYTPTLVSSLSNIIAISASSYYSLALKSDGTVWAWGMNESGQLGNGTFARQNEPVQVLGLSDIIQIDAGKDHAMALKKDGTVWTWGQGDQGQLGTHGLEKRNEAMRVEDIQDVVSIAAGGQHCLVVKDDGTIWAWGSNRSFVNSETAKFNYPVLVEELPVGFLKVEAIGNYSMATHEDGSVWYWGKLSMGYNYINEATP